jgi:hypothetical protein
VILTMPAVASRSLLASARVRHAQSAHLAPVSAPLRAHGPFARFPGEVPVPLRLTLRQRWDPKVIVTTFDQVKSPSWQSALSEPGAGSFVIANDDPDLNLAQLHDALVMFELHGWAAFTLLPRNIERVVLSPAENAGQLTKVAGPGTLAILEEALVYPSRGPGVWPIEDDRLFSWPAPAYDDSWWAQPWVMARWIDPTVWTTDAKLGSPPAPADWPDPECEWIWAPGTDWMLAPGGSCYARANFQVPEGVTRLRLYFAFDAAGTLYLDGQEIGTNTWALDSWKATQEEIAVTPGWHNVAVKATNDYLTEEDSNQTQNPGGILVAVYAAGPTGLIGDPLLRSNATDWRMLAYPLVEPGMTPGEAIATCVNEAKARGGLVPVTLAFDRYTDSAGAPWPIVGDIATKVGFDVLTFVRELSGTYIDVAMAPGGFVLYAWGRGYQGENTAVSLHGPTDPADPNSSNVAMISQKRVL